MSDYELLVKRIGLTGIASFVVALSPVILLPILTKILTIQEYGIWSLILVTAGFVPMVVLLGLPNSMVRFLAPVKNKDEIREGYYSIALVVLCAGFVSSFFLLLFEQSIAANLLGNNRTVALLLPLITFVAAYNYRATDLFQDISTGETIFDCLVSSGRLLRYTRRSVRGGWSRTHRGYVRVSHQLATRSHDLDLLRPERYRGGPCRVSLR